MVNATDMTEPNGANSCPASCPRCTEILPGAERPADRPTGRPDLLEGWRLVAASGYVFGLPPAAAIAAEVALGRRLGDLPALGVGLAAAAVLMVPAWLLLRRRRGGEEVGS